MKYQKPLSATATEKSWSETRLLREEELNHIDDLQYTPVIFREFIPAKSDLRVTVINNKIFCAEVKHKSPDYKYDYRVQMNDATISAHSLPPKVSKKILELMKKLGLNYGALDFRLTDEGDYVFLEINTSGQWLFIEKKSGLPITQNFVDYLIELNN